MKTRIGRKMDIGRLSSAVRRPGIDTRCWVSLAVALGDSFVDKDSEGVFVDVILMPTEEEYTARVGAEYAGGGFGFYAKIKKDDELCVATPSGDPAEGIVVLKRLWSAADLPPQQAIDNPEEVMLIIEPEKNFRLAVSGAGTLTIESEATITVNSPDVRLGGADPQNSVPRDDRVEAEIQTIVNAIKGGVPVANDGGAALQASIVTALTDPVGSTASDTTKVE